MKEVKSPKKPLIYYYCIVLLVLMVFNSFIVPLIARQQIKEVDYGTFMSMTEKGEIGKVEIESNQILFTDKDGQNVYKTGVMDDPNLTERLYASGAQFATEIVEEASPLMSFFLTWILPVVIFVALGQLLYKKMSEKMGGGPNSMMFGLGNSNAKVYVPSTDGGIRFADVAGEDEAKDNLQEIVNYLHDPSKYKAIGASMPKGILLVGPPGTGKTTLAKVIANTTSAEFTQINATVAGKKDMEAVVKEAQQNLGMYGKKTILFIDEIHRFNKGQQDYLLPFVEDGTIILIGATTENPYFEVNAALISRSIIFELKSLEISEVKELILRAVNDKTKGMGNYKARIDEDALDFLADMAGGDARNALNAIELGILTTPRSEDGLIHITLDVASQCIQKRVVRYDKNGDNHYDIISAFIKSMRGSDPDAAVYYLAKMLYAGEDVKFIARRIMILASEDIGNADPQALCVAVAAAQAVERVGMPESQIILSQAVTYMACAPKSNSAVNAIFAAMDSVKRTKTTVPPHLQDAHYGGHEKLGHGIGYKYAHDYPNHYVHQQYLPTEIQGEHFYELSEMGYEKTLKEYQTKIKSQS